jgi:hypothetical protein
MPISQNDSGRAFEYGIAVSCSRLLPTATLEDSLQMQKAKQSFVASEQTEQIKIVKASDEIVMFLMAHDERLTGKGYVVSLQSDQHGQEGDVRDVLITNTVTGETVGISAKNRHSAVKHSRLSEDIDFGTEWMDFACSTTYMQTVLPIFREMRSRKKNGEKWRDIADKKQRFYMPILQAFQTEMELLFATQPEEVAKRLVKYLLGKYDYYKVIKENGSVSVTSFNIDGSLEWGSRLPLPTRIQEIKMKPNSETTLFISFDKGWQLSFRIHNASTVIEPSLKFDINIIGNPYRASRHEIPYMVHG